MNNRFKSNLLIACNWFKGQLSYIELKPSPAAQITVSKDRSSIGILQFIFQDRVWVFRPSQGHYSKYLEDELYEISVVLRELNHLQQNH